jgi:hypothetical protein
MNPEIVIRALLIVLSFKKMMVCFPFDLWPVCWNELGCPQVVPTHRPAAAEHWLPDKTRARRQTHLA